MESKITKNVTKANQNGRSTVTIGMMQDPMLRINQLKEKEKRPTRPIPPKISSLEAVKCDISFQWMDKFEAMHQARVQAAEKFSLEKKEAIEKVMFLEGDIIKKKEEIRRLETQLEKTNEFLRDMKRLVKDQRKVIDSCSKQQIIILQQHKIIERQQKEVRHLRITSNRLRKRMVLKKNLKTVSSPEPEVKIELGDM